MALVIDSRLLEPNGEGEITENFNRVLALVDAGSGEVPVPQAADDGKILVADDGEWVVSDPPSGLPDVTSADEGKVLTVDSNGDWGAETPSGGGGLPAVTSADEGKFLVVDSNGQWVAATVPVANNMTF